MPEVDVFFRVNTQKNYPEQKSFKDVFGEEKANGTLPPTIMEEEVFSLGSFSTIMGGRVVNSVPR